MSAEDRFDWRGRVLDGPDDPYCRHGNYPGECDCCAVEARQAAERVPVGVNPWPDLDDLQALPY